MGYKRVQQQRAYVEKHRKLCAVHDRSGRVRYGLVWSGLVWYGLVWYGMVWSGLVWYGLVWSCMVWSGRRACDMSHGESSSVLFLALISPRALTDGYFFVQMD